MGFKEENYTPKGLRYMLLYTLIILWSLQLSSQAGHCPVRVDLEPQLQSQIRTSNSISQNSFPFFRSWENINLLKLSDDQYTHVELTPYRRSTIITASNHGFSIPSNATITGIEIQVEGHSEGNGFVEGLSLQLLDKNGNRVGEDKANNALPEGTDWLLTEDSTDVVWRYGNEHDTWGLDLENFMANNPSFGYTLQVRNKLGEEVAAFIDQVSVLVHYIPLYTMCSDHACVPFYVDKSDDPLWTYEWYIPEGYELISDSEHDPAINIKASYATFGTYEICVEGFYDGDSQGTCCRLFNYEDCNPGSISGSALLDKNGNFEADSEDENLENIIVNLYNSSNTLILSTSTDSDGNYFFDTVFEGDYYIEFVSSDETLVFVPSGIGSEENDSDVDDSNGANTTAFLSVEPEENVVDIDAILSQSLSIGDFIWEDLNGDGVQQEDEPGLTGVSVSLTNSITGTITTLSENGEYIFENLPSGVYSISFEELDTLFSTISNIGLPELDSDNTTDEIVLSYFDGGKIDSIDAGYVNVGEIGDFVWLDSNFDGLQQEGEPGIENMTIVLLGQGGAEVASTITDSSGYYLFENVLPATYSIRVDVDAIYTQTLLNVGGDKEIDSDILLVDGVFETEEFVFLSGDSRDDLDFGFVLLPSEIIGATWLDSNNDGIFQEGEPFIQNVNVDLFNENNELVASTMSDFTGLFTFTQVVNGNYYLVFEQPNNHVFTIANVGDDLSNSDVDEVIAAGATAIFQVLPNEIIVNNSAGYQLLPKVGNLVWLDINRNGIQDDTENGIEGIKIYLIDENNEIIDSTSSNENGAYLFDSLDIGSYSIEFESIDTLEFTIQIDSLADKNSDIDPISGKTSFFDLVGNECNFDIDAGYNLQKRSISGEAWVDSDADGIQASSDLLLANIEVGLYNSDDILIEVSETNADGQYLFSQIDAGDYYVQFSVDERYIPTIPLEGVDQAIDSDITESLGAFSTDLLTLTIVEDIENIDLGVIDGASDLSGQVWIDLNADGVFTADESVIEDVLVRLFELNGQLVDSVFTDNDGKYVFESLEKDSFYITFDAEDDYYVNTLANIGMDDTIDDDVTSSIIENSTDTIFVDYFNNIEFINAGFYQLASIGDFAFLDVNENGINDSEPGLDNVVVNLLKEGTIVKSTATMPGGGQDSGYYLLEGIVPGEYQIQFIRPLFYQFIAGDQGSDDAADSDVVIVNDNEGFTDFFTIVSGEQNLDLDAGFIFQVPMESSISGAVWTDENANGIFDSGELLLEQVVVNLLDEDEDLIDSKMTDIQGEYSFDMLTEGFYTIEIELPSGTTLTEAFVGMDTTIDSDFENDNSGLASTVSFFLNSFESKTDVDLGTVELISIGDFVWNDFNLNGAQDAGEEGIGNIEVRLSNASMSVDQSVLTDENGLYSFVDIPAGVYQVCVTLPDGISVTDKNTTVQQLDNDADLDGCIPFSPILSSTNDLDFGLTQNGSISGVAFVDLNGNGVKNNVDPGLDEVPVKLFDSNDVLIAETMTQTIDDISGQYSFTDVPAGENYIIFEYPDSYIYPTPNVGLEDTDSEITGTFGTGSTDIFVVGSGEDIVNFHGGAYLPACISTLVFEDLNMDGLQDDGELGVPDIQVIIFRSFGVAFDTVVTDAEGKAKFSDLKQGLYFVQYNVGEDLVISPADVGIDDNIDSDADETGKTPLISLAHGAILTSVDCGVFTGMNPTLRSIAWEDINGDGIRQNVEGRVPGIRVTLFDDTNTAVASTLTNSLGLYAFVEIPEGDYKVFVDLDGTNYSFIDANVGGDDNADSDIYQDGYSDLFNSGVDLSVSNIDVGLFEGGTINGLVWDDANQNGIAEYEEKPISGIKATLWTKKNIKVKSIITSENTDNLIFDNLKPGSYYITYSVEKDQSIVKYGSMDLDHNNDAYKMNGQYRSPVFSVESGRVVTNIDAGFYTMEPHSVVDAILTENEVEEAHEKEQIEDVKSEMILEVHPNPAANYVTIDVGDNVDGIVTLMDAQKRVVKTMKVAEAKELHLENLHPGIYYIMLEANGKKVSKKILKVQ